MKTPWIENYRGEWANGEGFVISIRPSDERRASVDITLKAHPIIRPWCADSKCEDLNAVYRGDEGLGLEVDLGRDGFSLFLDYEWAGSMFEQDCIAASVSRYEHDQEAEHWSTIFGLGTYFRREREKPTI